MSLRSTAAAGCLVAALSLGVAACGSDDNNSSDSGGGTVDIYSSLPLQGASKAQTGAMVQGMKLAIEQADNKAGDTTVKYDVARRLDRAGRQLGSGAGRRERPQGRAGQGRRRLHRRVQLRRLGDLDPDPEPGRHRQVSPANTYPGLTTSEPGTEKGEPDKYYPTGKRNYTRIVPRDKIQAAALVKQFQDDGCTSVAIANDKETYGAGLSRIVVLDAEAANLKVSQHGDPEGLAELPLLR